ncbi:hypothetical protein XENTR_v10005000 [Xenopus tropicalis]|uniref:BTG family member 3 n=1 Tax=Xenopus tropicalis TaxID=8364 RepID=F6VQW7_XENTR|nr:protein BTG3 [Xenopus tropicalis]AAI18747.1 btg3 protein [Xenopus tropicalis]KAE8621858.1 hypothetical protein XENTR_v10005000 [Xenopus tropicalis]KAE8621859.1 hypothetical protein XENTR_v10005000 [Xenopus tropicalis]|eukprot:NP_001090840.1 protein BTG3 [Xenopus tropicalis]
MKNEIAAVVFFLSKLIRKNEKIRKEEVDRFSEELTRLLYDKFVNHWYPATPTKGQAYRCIRVNKFQGPDPDLLKACLNSGLEYEDLGLPKEFTLWVDPWEVCCRCGEKNHAFLVASIESKDNDRMEISEQVTHVVDKAVTSDYHSGSSSDDEVYFSTRKAQTGPGFIGATHTHQGLGVKLQPVPAWNKYHKRKQGPLYQYDQRMMAGYVQQPRGSKMHSQVPWLPPILQNDSSHWAGLPLLPAGPQCLV